MYYLDDTIHTRLNEPLLTMETIHLMSGNATLLPDLPLLSGDQFEWLYLCAAAAHIQELSSA
jgi:hypothetical protein